LFAALVVELCVAELFAYVAPVPAAVLLELVLGLLEAVVEL